MCMCSQLLGTSLFLQFWPPRYTYTQLNPFYQPFQVCLKPTCCIWHWKKSLFSHDKGTHCAKWLVERVWLCVGVSEGSEQQCTEQVTTHTCTYTCLASGGWIPYTLSIKCTCTVGWKMSSCCLFALALCQLCHAHVRKDTILQAFIIVVRGSLEQGQETMMYFSSVFIPKILYFLTWL